MLGYNTNGNRNIAPWLRYPIAFYGGFEVFRGVSSLASLSSTPVANPIPEFLTFVKPLDSEMHKVAAMISPGINGGSDIIVGLAVLWSMGYWDPMKVF